MTTTQFVQMMDELRAIRRALENMNPQKLLATDFHESDRPPNYLPPDPDRTNF